ncbi:MAG: menaquinone biosynthetic enzyme MqnA/MqnD family protein [Bacteroidota bacterium]
MNSNQASLSVVSYINSIPFVVGLEKSQHPSLKISKDIPSECATKLIEGKVDIGLIPVAMISKVPNARIISDYCISGNGKVASVLLVSNSPIENIEIIYQDNQSRTSVALAKILMRDYWKKEIDWRGETTNFLNPTSNEGIVIIGDRALKHYHTFKYCYDLSEHWKLHTGYPFVFACWVANKEIPEKMITVLNESFQYGISQIENFCDSVETNSDITGREYLTNFIQYHLTDDAKKGMELFLKLLPLL